MASVVLASKGGVTFLGTDDGRVVATRAHHTEDAGSLRAVDLSDPDNDVVFTEDDDLLRRWNDFKERDIEPTSFRVYPEPDTLVLVLAAWDPEAELWVLRDLRFW